MVVVSDTTAITSLLKIGAAELLEQLFGSVFVPEAVRFELGNYHDQVPAFLTIRSVQDRPAVARLLQELDRGEAEAIVLAKELHAEALLIDEKRARAIAESEGVRCLGLAGALLLAKQRAIVTNLEEMLNRLERQANFYLLPTVKRELLRQAGEAT